MVVKESPEGRIIKIKVFLLAKISGGFNGRLRDELLNGEIFYTLKEAQILIECWRQEYNTMRPHSALGYKPPAPEAIQPIPRDPGSATLRQDFWLDLTPTLT